MGCQKQTYVGIFVLLTVCIVYIIVIAPQNISNSEDGMVPQLISKTDDTVTDAIIVKNQKPMMKHRTWNVLPVWSHDLTGVWTKRFDICKKVTFDKVTTLVTPFGNLPIHVHDPTIDIWVSKRIINTGSFDLGKIKTIANFLESDPALNFIDIGANLGTYSLTFAKLGRKVLSVDALNLNIEKLCSSVNQSHFEDRVYMIMNAISSRHETVSLAADDKNYGGTFIDQNADYIKSVKGKTVTGLHYNNISTIVFDDLLTLPFISLFPRVFIKMDIEGFEHKALERAHQFFANIFIQGIQIEWIFHRNKESGQMIVVFLEQYSFIPYNPNSFKPLPKSVMGDWATQDVLWLRQ